MILCGCSSGSSGGASGPHFDTPAQLVAQLKAKGAPCVRYKTTNPKEGIQIGPSAASSASCTLDGELVEIAFYKDKGEMDNVEGIGKSIGCSVAKGFGVKTLDYVRGDVWEITPDSETTAKKLANALGATEHHVKC